MHRVFCIHRNLPNVQKVTAKQQERYDDRGPHRKCDRYGTTGARYEVT